METLLKNVVKFCYFKLVTSYCICMLITLLAFTANIPLDTVRLNLCFFVEGGLNLQVGEAEN